MYNFIFLLGAQGSGKTTIARILKEELGFAHIDFDWLRDPHLNKQWSNATNLEKKMSFENLIFILNNYKKHNYRNVVVGGFTEEDMKRILTEFKDDKYIVITLFLTDNEELKKRVLTESRDSGFRDFKQSIKFNKKLREGLRFPNEHKIDNTSRNPVGVISRIKNLLSK